MGIVTGGQEGVNAENKGEISGGGRVLREREESPGSQALWDSDSETWGRGGTAVSPLTGWGWRQR